MAEPLDNLPIDVLLALQDAMANPTEEGMERARLRAEDAGFWLQCNNSEAGAAPAEPEPEPEPMDPPPPGTRGVVLDLSEGLSPVLSARRNGRDEP